MLTDRYKIEKLYFLHTLLSYWKTLPHRISVDFSRLLLYCVVARIDEQSLAELTQTGRTMTLAEREEKVQTEMSSRATKLRMRHTMRQFGHGKHVVLLQVLHRAHRLLNAQ